MTEHLTAEEVCRALMICDGAPPEKKSRYMKEATDFAAWLENPVFSTPYLDYPPLIPHENKLKTPAAVEPPPPPPPPVPDPAPVQAKKVQSVIDIDDWFSF
jgi:hypothetical protein